jgi:cytosine/adenosine deaminase-related metal-dependent hydrolase
MALTEYLIAGGTLVSMDKSRAIILDGAVAVSDARIVEVGTRESLLPRHPSASVVDARGMLVIPGLVDGHNHPAHYLTKGLLDDIATPRRWATRLYPFDVSVTSEQSYWGSMGSFAEMIRSGTTCVADPGSYQPEATIRAALDIGIRACITRSTRDISDPMRPTPDDLNVSPQAAVKKVDELHAEWHGAGEGRIRIWYGLRTSSNVSDALCRLVKSRADSCGAGIHVHLAVNPAETAEVQKKFGLRPVERFRRLGLMDENLYAVHMGALDDVEVEVVAKTGTKVCHCASASMFGAFGCIAHGKFVELAAAGATMSLGTDAAAISRFLDLVREMYIVACAHKDVAIDAEVMGAHKAFEMATIDGARALLWDDQIGSIEAGKRADLVLVRTDGLEWYPRPLLNPVANLVYSSSGAAVDSVMIDGKWVMRKRKLLTIEEDKLKQMVVQNADSAARGAKIPEEQRWPVH